MILSGKVKFFSEKKGYGFIESNQKQYFFHFSELQMEGYKTIETGESVEFTPASGQKGERATCVTISKNV